MKYIGEPLKSTNKTWGGISQKPSIIKSASLKGYLLMNAFPGKEESWVPDPNSWKGYTGLRSSDNLSEIGFEISWKAIISGLEE
jgi:hypothetical protein